MNTPNPVLIFSLTPAQTYHLMRPVAGQGGWQDFFEKLQEQIEDDGGGGVLLTLEDTDIGRAMRGMVGDGGFQGRLKKILARQIINFLEEL
jgi:hypothetical protein